MLYEMGSVGVVVLAVVLHETDDVPVVGGGVGKRVGSMDMDQMQQEIQQLKRQLLVSLFMCVCVCVCVCVSVSVCLYLCE